MSDSTATAGIVLVGNEILAGKIQDLNSTYLCRELRFLGVEVCRVLVIPDEFETIAQTVKEYSEKYTWVFTSGGIGPTHDDLTVPAIASGFGASLVESPEIAEVIQKYYGDRTTSAHMRMAMIPQGAILLQKDILSLPQVQFHNIFIFPGTPELVRNRFQALKEMFRQQPIFLKEIFLKADEGLIAESLHETLRQFPQLLLGSYPEIWREDYTLKLTLESKSHDYLMQAFEFLYSRLPPSQIVQFT